MADKPNQCMVCGAKDLQAHIRKVVEKGFYSHAYKPKWKERKK